MKTITAHTCTNTAADAIRQWVSGTIKAEQGQTKAVDALFADGIVPADLESPAKGADRTAYDSFRFAIVTGFPAEAKKLVQADKAVAKGYTDQQKADRRYWQQQIGSKLKDLRNSLAKRYEAKRIAELTPEQREAEAAEAESSATLEARFLRDMSAWVTRLEKAEACAFSVVEAVKHLKALTGLASAEVTKH